MIPHFKYILITILFFYSSNLLSQDIILAVIGFEGKGVSQVEASALTDRLRTEILGTVKMKVVERGEMEELLKEQEFQQTGCVSSECMVEAGKLLGANQIVGGSISRVGNTFSVNARIMNVKTGKLIKTYTYDYSGKIDEIMKYGMKEVAFNLSGIEKGSQTLIGGWEAEQPLIVNENFSIQFLQIYPSQDYYKWDETLGIYREIRDYELYKDIWQERGNSITCEEIVNGAHWSCSEFSWKLSDEYLFIKLDFTVSKMMAGDIMKIKIVSLSGIEMILKAQDRMQRFTKFGFQ